MNPPKIEGQSGVHKSQAFQLGQQFPAPWGWLVLTQMVVYVNETASYWAP